MPAFTQAKIQACFDYLVWHVTEFGFQPTKQEMSIHFGVRPNTIKSWCVQLEKQGKIKQPFALQERCLLILGVNFVGGHVANPSQKPPLLGGKLPFMKTAEGDGT